MRIADNLPALTAFNALAENTNRLQNAIKQLSTGLRINSASDDAAGFAISEKMRSQIRGLDTALRNSQDGISLLQTAEGALGEANSVLQRMRELAVQASNDSLTSNDRQYIQLEIDELKKQIDRISDTTQFNKKRILDGSSGAIWSSNDMNVKVRINGGLTYIDEFGQKVSAEGNYRIEVKADGGQAQVQKSNIFNVSTIEINPPEEIEEVEEVTHNYDDIDINIEELSGTMSGDGWSFENQLLTISKSGSYHIYGTNNGSNQNGVAFSAGVEVDILLENVDILGWTVPFDCTGAKVDLYLRGENRLAGTLGVPDGAELTINSAEGYGSESGKLLAYSNDEGAGIGGDARNGLGRAGTITINGGTIDARGRFNGAGIGGGMVGYAATGGPNGGGTITINGGNVTAIGGKNYAAGIGTGYYAGQGDSNASDNTVIKITGGTVYAEGGKASAGIGGGWGTAGGDITISGGNITAIGGTDNYTRGGGAGIGGGENGNGGNITISGGTISATGGLYAAGIGGGTNGTSGTIRIQRGLYSEDNTGAVKAFKGPDNTGTGGNATTALDIGHGHSSTVDDVDLNAQLQKEIETPVPAYQIREFYNEAGTFLLSKPQTLTITQGDGQSVNVMLYEHDTMNDIAKKINDAIANSLGQGRYTDNKNKFCTISDGTEGTSESIYEKVPVYSKEIYKRDEAGEYVLDEDGNRITLSLEERFEGYEVNATMLIRSVIPGKAGELYFSGDEDLLNALGLNTIQESQEAEFTVSLFDAHSGKIIARNMKSASTLLKNLIAPNIDVDIDPMTGFKAAWNESAKRFIISSDEDYSAVIHLKDSGVIFQTGANMGEDFIIQLGDFSCYALGISNVNISTRETASRAISTIDKAINKLSAQRSMIGAYENALEHTITNLTTASMNLTSAESRIRDADMSKIMLDFVKLQILNQSGTSMLSQANQLPQSVLSLLQ